MSDLIATLGVSSGALAVYDQAFAVVQNNVANSSTPGYADQEMQFDAGPFDPEENLVGGVQAGQVQSTRNQYAEQAVREQTTLLGNANQLVSSLTSLQSAFPVTADTGIPSALNQLFQAFSSWATSPNDGTAQQSVLNGASAVATAFQQTASQLAGVASDTEQQIQQTVSDVNNLVSQLQADNVQIQNGGQNNAGLDAQVTNTLDQLSQYVDITVLPQSDGTKMVLLNGQTPLLVGTTQYQISADLNQPSSPPPVYPSGPPNAQVLASDGTDITSETTGGQLGALLNVYNNVLPSYIGDSSQQGSLNQMAQQLADTVNNLLTSGNISDGPPAVPGVALFSYGGADGTQVAQTLAVNPTITPGQLAAIDPGPPEVSNGIALQLAQLADPQNSAQEIGGVSYSQFYGNMAAQVGTLLDNATNTQQSQQQAVTQAENIRQQVSGVSLDQEATEMIQYQQAYQANAQMVTILDQLSQDVIYMMQYGNQ
jgi:flagellar hook-associated protein 1